MKGGGERISDETHPCLLLLHKYRHPRAPNRNHEATAKVGRMDGVKSARLKSCILNASLGMARERSSYLYSTVDVALARLARRCLGGGEIYP